MVEKRYIFQTIIFRIYVKFGGCFQILPPYECFLNIPGLSEFAYLNQETFNLVVLRNHLNLQKSHDTKAILTQKEGEYNINKYILHMDLDIIHPKKKNTNSPYLYKLLCIM